MISWISLTDISTENLSLGFLTLVALGGCSFTNGNTGSGFGFGVMTDKAKPSLALEAKANKAKYVVSWGHYRVNEYNTVQ